MTATLGEAARSYLGTPWLDSGRSRQGIDCLGLVLCAARDIGVDMDPERSFNRRTEPAQLRRAIAPHARMVALANAAPGDIILLDMTSALQVGILTSGESLGFIYSMIDRGVVELKFKADHFRVRGVFRLCGSN